jgi:glycosyltransferase involved in cell wall biosynthesis
MSFNMVPTAVYGLWRMPAASASIIPVLNPSAEAAVYAAATVRMPDVSAIIPTLDCAAHLARCLGSLDAQRDVDVEVIVVDQRSGDGTADIARAYGARVLSLSRPAYYRPPTRSRNVGARAATGRFLAHLDADMELPSGLLAEATALCRRDGVSAVVLHERDVPQNFWAAVKALEREAYVGVAGVEGARFVRADVFSAVGGYDEELGSGEDWDIHARYAQHGAVVAASEALLHHSGRVSFGRQVLKKFAYGRSARPFLDKHGGPHVASAMLSAYWSSRRTFAQHPALALGFLVLRAAETVAVAAGLTYQSARDRRILRTCSPT